VVGELVVAREVGIVPGLEVRPVLAVVDVARELSVPRAPTGVGDLEPLAIVVDEHVDRPVALVVDLDHVVDRYGRVGLRIGLGPADDHVRRRRPLVQVDDEVGELVLVDETRDHPRPRGAARVLAVVM
jgi:hypothetical protein